LGSPSPMRGATGSKTVSTLSIAPGSERSSCPRDVHDG
jgi:hypothetical protein